MILADTSVWIEHFRGRASAFARRLENDEVLIHPFVLGELMLSGLYRRPDYLSEIRALPAATVALPDEVALLIESHALDGRGIGYVDTALLASASLAPGTRLATFDRRLESVAAELGIAETRLAMG